MENSVEKPEERKFIVSASPHILNDDSTRGIMWTVSFFLLPAAFFGIYAFGFYAGIVILTSVLFALATEAVCQLIRKRPVAIDDGSAFLTGLLLGMNMPPTVPLYIPILSSIFAIAIVKQTFGGLGQNWANPAIAGRVFALIAWGKHMTSWKTPFISDAVSTATPLGAVKSAIMEAGDTPLGMSVIELLKSLPNDVIALRGETAETIYRDLFFGLKGGSIGEVSVFLLLVGALYLVYRRIITLDIPLAFVGTVAFMAWVFGGLELGTGLFSGDVLFHMLTGGLVLGAFFMATDMVTTPITIKGRIIFGIGCGVVTVLIRIYGGMAEGVSLAILFMNMLTPAIDHFIKIKPMGYMKDGKEVQA